MFYLPPPQFTSSRIMTLAKEVEKERDAPKAREATYILLDLVGVVMWWAWSWHHVMFYYSFWPDGRRHSIPHSRPAGVLFSLLTAQRLVQLCVPKTTSMCCVLCPVCVVYCVQYVLCTVSSMCCVLCVLCTVSSMCCVLCPVCAVYCVQYVLCTALE